MEIVFVLVPLALILVAIAAGFFIWAVRSGQYDNIESEAAKILLDEEDGKLEKNTSNVEQDIQD